MSQAITQPVYAEWEFETYEKNPIPPVYPHDSEGIDVYSAKLDAARKHAYHNPLAAGQSYKLALTVPQTNPCPSARRVPHVPQSPSVFVRLDRPLQTGAGNMSQVWTAGVEGTGTTLVLKIIQPSLCPYPAPDRCWTMYEAPEDLARGEAWAYERIVHKQGLLVPYFFGLDQITTPSGEPAWVLALEYIPSVTLASFLDSPARTKLSLDAAEDFGSDGWRHLDPMPDNILVTDCFGTRGVVFIDYSFICRLPPSEWSDNYPCEELYHQIVECMDFDVGFQQWADENIAAVRRFNTQWN